MAFHRDDIAPSSVHHIDFFATTDPALSSTNNVADGKHWLKTDNTTTPTWFEYYRRNNANTAWILLSAWTGIPDNWATGDVLYVDASGRLKNLGIGTSGQVLAVATGLPAWAAAASGVGSLVLLDEQIASTSASLDMTIGIDDTYDEYVLEGGQLVADNAAAVLRMQVSTDGGSTWVTTASYGWLYSRRRAGSTGDAAGGASSGATFMEIMNFSMGTGTGEHQNFTARCRSLRSAALYKVFRFDWEGYVSTPDLSSGEGSGVYLAATQVDALKLFPSVGNFASGWARLYGVTK